MQASEIIILAGGSGSRLSPVLPGIPKILAPIGSGCFLDILMHEYKSFQHFIFSLGYLQEQVVEYMERHYAGLHKHYAIETAPLDTGGGLRGALQLATTADPVVVNGDTLFRADLDSLHSYHCTNQAYCTLALKAVDDRARYGAVEINASGRVSAFRERVEKEKMRGEKGQPRQGGCSSGLINGGVYVINRDAFLEATPSAPFSLERHLFESVPERRIFGISDPGYFIDIGVPEDYEKAKQELSGYTSAT